MSAHNFARVYLLALLFVVMGGIEGCDTEDLSGELRAVHGNVVDSQGKAIASALIRVADSSYSCLTNVEGSYVLNLPSGHYDLEASKEGFLPLRKSLPSDHGQPKSETRLDFTLLKAGTQDLTLELKAQKSVFSPGEIVEFKLIVEKQGAERVSISRYGFWARDGRGKVLWKCEKELGSSSNTLEGDEKLSLSKDWDWFRDSLKENCMEGTSSGQCLESLQCFGYLLLEGEDKELLSPVLELSFVEERKQPQEVETATVDKGDYSQLKARHSFVIKNKDEWRDLWLRHAPDRALPEIGRAHV